MWRADAATRPHHEVEEAVGLLNGSQDAGRHEEAARSRWYRDAKERVQNLFESGYNGWSIPGRREDPGRPSFETRSRDTLDWRDRPHKTTRTVSPFRIDVYIYNVAPFPFCPLHAGYLSAHSTIVCLLNLYCSSSFIRCLRACSKTFPSCCQATCILYANTPLAFSAFPQQPPLNYSKSSLAGQLTSLLSELQVISSTHNYTELQHTHCNHGCI